MWTPATESLTPYLAKGHTIPWTKEEAKRLRGWFERHRNLSKKEIEKQYLQFSGKDRSHKALQAQLYLQGCGYLTNKRKKTSLGADEAFKPPTSVPAPFDTETSLDHSRISQALHHVSGSLACPPQQPSRPENGRNEVELNSLSRDSQRSRSGSHVANGSRELSDKPNPPTKDARPDCRNGANGNSPRANRTITPPEEHSSEGSPAVQCQSSHYEPIHHSSGIGYPNEPQTSLPGKETYGAFNF